MRPLFLLLLSLLCTCVRAQLTYFPPAADADWEQTSAASLGYHPDSVTALYDYLEDTQTKGFVLLKDGRIVLEKYFGTFVQDSIWYWASAAKSLKATLVGIAQGEGALDVNNPTSDYLGTGWTSLPPEQEDSITVWNQLTMTTGFNGILFECTTPGCLIRLADAGTRWNYHNAPYLLLKDVLEAATNTDLNIYTNQQLENKIGMKTGTWIRQGFAFRYFSRVRDAARFGHLILAEGKWADTEVVTDKDYLREMLQSSQDLNAAYGYLWWLNGQDNYLLPADRTIYPGPIAPAAPEDLVVAAGKNGQFVSVVPSEGLVMVRFGDSSSDDFAPLDYHNSIWERLTTLEGTTASREPKATALGVFPNPARRNVWVKLPTQGRYYFELFDGRGRRCKAGTTNGRIDVASLPAGAYVVRLSRADKRYVARVIKR